MENCGSTDGERRRHARATLQLPVQLSENGGANRLAECETVNVSQEGLLLRGTNIGGLVPGRLIEAYVGLPPEVRGHGDGYFSVRVKRVEESGQQCCAVEVVGAPPAFLFAPELVGKHSSILQLKRTLADLLDFNVNVLIQGETGTGKNVVAELIHRYSRRSSLPFVRLNCPSIPDALLESELFGHEKGAFTDAKAARPGVFRLAHRGVLVLDEISAIPSSLQAKLLHAIEEKTFMPLGGAGTVKVDVRIIATTNENLKKRMREGAFRKDLFYRLDEVPLTVSPLRDRKGDIPLLADYFLRKYAAEFGKAYEPLGKSETKRLQNYGWPGNVRELENIVKRNILLGHFEIPELERWGKRDAAAREKPPERSTEPFGEKTIEEGMRRPAEPCEKAAVIGALEAADNNRTKAAADLDISYRTLLRRMKKYGIKV